MKMSDDAEKIITKLENSGFEAYFVGGCVRDKLMGRPVHDYDITTNALPEQIMNVFKDFHLITAGLKHGTVTVIYNKAPYEITTYRIDGGYSDSRHPDSVKFTSNLEDDLVRRDFTINSIAMDKQGIICDPLGGSDDIKKGVIRCVGDPTERFTEDALRILRALRFSSQLGFEIDRTTSDTLLSLCENIKLVSAERIRDELDRLLCGENCASVMLKYREIIAQIIPELRSCFDFEQHSRYHKYDVYTHIVKSMEAAPRDSILLRRAMLFHDIGKPQMFTIDKDGEGHFKGHASVSAEKADEIMTRLRYSRRDISITRELIFRHSDKIQSDRQIKRIVSQIGEEAFFLLIEMKKADNRAKREFVLTENKTLESYEEKARRFIAQNSCMKLSQLAVNGNDMIDVGLKGKDIGKALDRILTLVIDDSLPNERETLLEYARENYYG